jgi:polyhydroxyalkanoate synthase subunit PhaC
MSENSANPVEFFQTVLTAQGEALRRLVNPFFPGASAPALEADDLAGWMDAGQRLQALWLEFQQALLAEGEAPTPFADLAKWFAYLELFYKRLPFADPDTQQRLWEEGLGLWENVLGLYGIGPRAGEAAASDAPELPRKDRRFADPRWRAQPVFAIIHQTYLMLADQIEASIAAVDGIADDKREQLRFAVRSLIDALSPANYPLTNPVVIERTMETRGDNLVKGMGHLLADLKRGQLSHTDPDAFIVGKDIAVTPGKVVHETPLFQLIQYSPATADVLATPLVIFPPWINRFYILDLNPKKSFVKWAVDQGLSVFIASWKSADESMADVAWDDYIRAQIEAVDVVRARLKVPAVHTIGYCAAGTTLAATLAILARRGEAGKVASATFFTAQVDFEHAGELKLLCDDATLTLADQISAKGYLDGRFMAAAFNALRGQDLIWNYVVNNYLLGEDYPAFDLLFWNGDTTNLPARWHHDYTRDLYRDNRLVIPDALSADGTPIDLTRITTPSYVQAGKEDHIAPPESVFRMTRHLRGASRFVLAGSGHIAGVVNPPSANKYQYWTNDRPVCDLPEFISGAVEHPGSWWPDWLEWIRAFGTETVPATGKRKPGGRGEAGLEDAPGRYVKAR